MAENSSSGGSSMASTPTRSDDPAWAHGQVVVGAKNSSICVHCSKMINGGGITRLKYQKGPSRCEMENEAIDRGLDNGEREKKET